ncbi:MAG: nuclear transport factor 2 family protein [Deltaproteobacteria bacterium]|jgi:hypothetical protein|nr:nuclear transport factor 2 family protein [Deltaproteobacteria bacterium]
MDPELAISRTIALYGQLLDDRRFDDWGRLFTLDAIWAIPGVTLEGRAAIVEGVAAMEPPVTGLVRHLSFTPIVEIDAPGHALAWTDLMAMSRPERDAAWEIAAVGRYCAGLFEVDGRWLFKHRAADIDPHERPAPAFVPTPRL